MADDEQPTAEPDAQPADAPEADAEAAVPDEAAGPAPKRADVLRDFRKTLADRHRHGAGKHQKPAGGNPRFR